MKAPLKSAVLDYAANGRSHSFVTEYSRGLLMARYDLHRGPG
jgi:hypothetical protein